MNIRHISLALLLLFFICSCNSQQADNKKTNVGTTNTNSECEKNEKQEEWNFVINPPKVGLISTKNRIPEILDLLPPDYSIVKDSAVFGDDEYYDMSVFYAVRKGNKTIFMIFLENNRSDKISSICILSPEYTIVNTDLRVGATIKTLKKTFSIKDSYFDYSSGLYIYCHGFDGSFFINLEGEEYESLELLQNSRKIGKIVIY